jgi:Protein of unknown function (DUF642)
MKLTLKPFVLGCLVFGCSSLQAANLIANPDFESPALTTTAQVFASGASIGSPGWTVTGACGASCVTLVASNYTETYGTVTLSFVAQHGLQSLNLAGPGNTLVGGVQQTVTTTPGTKYLLSFYVGNTDNNSPGSYALPSAIQVFLNGASQGIFSNNNNTPNQLNWQQFSMNFVAPSAATTVQFVNVTPNADHWAGLDNVFLDVVPAASSAVLPHFATGGGFVTGFYVVNTSTQSANFSISFYNDNGQPVSLPFGASGNLSTLTGAVPGNGARYFEAGTPEGTLVSGSGVITADPSIVVQSLFRRLGADNSYYEVAVPSSTGENEFEIPFDATTFAANNSQIYTGIAIANLDPLNAANVVCTARDSNGNVITNAVTVPLLSPLGHWANYQFPALTGQRGTLDCTSSTRIASIGIRALGNNALSSLPVIVIR